MANPQVKNPSAQSIVDTCETHWSHWKSDCSGFVKAVSKELNIYMSAGQANAIVDWLTYSSSWINLGTDRGKAHSYAADGYFVIGGSKSTGHGHVAVIVATGDLNRPNGYWGQFGGVGKKNTSITYSWGPSHTVNFFAFKVLN